MNLAQTPTSVKKNVFHKSLSPTLSRLNQALLGLTLVTPLAVHYQPGSSLLLKAMSGLNAINALSNTVSLSLGIYDLVHKKSKSYQIQSMMIAFGLLGLSSFGLSLSSRVQEPFLNYHTAYTRNAELLSKDFERLPMERRQYNLYHVRQQIENKFTVQEEKQIFRDMRSRIDDERKNERLIYSTDQWDRMFEQIPHTVQSIQGLFHTVQTEQISFPQAIQNRLINYEVVPDNFFEEISRNMRGFLNNAEKTYTRRISREFHYRWDVIKDQIEGEQAMLRSQFSRFLVFKHLLNIVNASFAFGGGMASIYSYFSQQRDPPINTNEVSLQKSPNLSKDSKEKDPMDNPLQHNS